jgi:hypothetical protein
MWLLPCMQNQLPNFPAVHVFAVYDIFSGDWGIGLALVPTCQVLNAAELSMDMSRLAFPFPFGLLS